MTRALLPTLLSLFLLLVLGDLAAFFFPAVSVVPFTIWCFSYLTFFGASLFCIYYLLKKAFKGKAIVTVLLVLLHLIIVMKEAGDPANLGGESPQQVACILKHIDTAADLGFNKSCFLGYPAKQYILHAVPTLIFGRSLWALNFGGALWFILALPIFAAGITVAFSKYRYSDLLNAITLALIFHFTYFTKCVFYFEQAGFPVGFSLAAFGLFLLYQKIKEPAYLLLLSILLVHANYTYTPSLSQVGLALFVFLALIFTAKKHLKVLITVTLLLILDLIPSFLIRHDVNFKGSDKALGEVLNEVAKGLVNVLLKTEGGGIAPDYTTYYFFFVFTLGIAGILRKEGFLLASWILGVFMASMAFRGYAYYALDTRLFRTIVAIPALLLLSQIFITKIFRDSRYTSVLLLPLLVLVVFYGLKHQDFFLAGKKVSPVLELISYLKGKDIELTEYVVIRSANTNHYFGSKGDYFQYFLPGVHSDLSDKECNTLPKRLGRDGGKGIYISSAENKTEECAAQLSGLKFEKVLISNQSFKIYFIS